MTTDEFVQWFTESAARLRVLPATQAVDEIADQLTALDDRLSVEVGNDERVRELILSASGEESLFSSVEELAVRLEAPGWAVVALMPPRGFGFVHRASDGRELDVSTLHFEPLTSASNPTAIGVCLMVPRHAVEWFRDAAWQVLLHGLGERVAARIAHVEVAEAPRNTSEYLRLAELPRYVEWHRSRQMARS